jgi:hypothetical protein
MSTADPAIARLENLRRSVAMGQPHAPVTLHREDLLDLLALTLQLAADGRNRAS